MNRQFPISGISPLSYFLGIASAIGVVFALINSEDSDNFFKLLLQWQMQTLIPVIFMIVTHLTLHRAKTFNLLGVWAKILLSGLLGATLFVPLAAAIDIYFMGEAFPTDIFGELTDEWAGVAPPAVIVWLLMNTPWVLNLQFTEDQLEVKNGEPTQVALHNQPKFMQMIDSELGKDLLYLSAELHYLDVVTTKGHQLVLYSLRDAVKELPESLGMQIHRSFYVVYVAVDKFEQKGRQGELRIKNGHVLPVSRNRLQAFQSAYAKSESST